MARVKLDTLVNTGKEFYGVTTCAAMLDKGQAFVERVDKFGKNEVTKYFVTLIDPTSGLGTMDSFEIGKYAYDSRAAKGQNVKPNEPVSVEEELTIDFTGDTLQIGSEVRPVRWDAESDSFELIIPRHAWKSDVVRAMKAKFEVVEYHSAMYGESYVVNFT